MAYVNIALGLIMVALSLAARAEPRKHDPAAQRSFNLALAVVGFLLAACCLGMLVTT